MIKTLVAAVYNDSMFYSIFIISLPNDNMHKHNNKHAKKKDRLSSQAVFFLTN